MNGKTGNALTLRDIGIETGLSPAAVSLALRNSPRVSAATRERVKKAAVEMGYQANPAVSGLMSAIRTGSSRSRLRTIGILDGSDVPRERNLMIASAIGKASEMHMGHDVVRVLEENMTLEKLSRLIHTRNFDALLITGVVWWIGDRIDFLIKECGDRPLVWMGVASAPWPIPTCCIDYFQASYRTTARTISYGYRRVVLVIPSYVPKVVKRRLLAGFFAAFDFAGDRFTEMVFEYETLREDDRTIRSTSEKKRFQDWLQNAEADAIICLHLDLKNLLPEIGYRVPEDIAYADFDVELEKAGEVAGLLPLHEAVGATAIGLLEIQMRSNESLENHTVPSCGLSGKWVDGATMPRLLPEGPRVLI